MIEAAIIIAHNHFGQFIGSQMPCTSAAMLSDPLYNTSAYYQISQFKVPCINVATLMKSWAESHFPMQSPFNSISCFILAFIPSTDCAKGWMDLTANLLPASLLALLYSCTCCLCNWLSIQPHKFSVGDKSGQFAGKSKNDLLAHAWLSRPCC